MLKASPTFLMLAVIILTLFFHACGARSIEPQRQQPAANSNHTRFPEATPTPQQPETTVTEFLKSQFRPLEEKESSAIVRAWGKVPHRENYVMGQNDYGEIAGAWGLASFVVDRTVATSKRFSLLVFIRRPGNRYDLYWIYRNEDLSRLSMSRSSGDIFVSGTREDGSSVNCEIEWSRKDNRWTCLSF
jgi:hypothetical protein